MFRIVDLFCGCGGMSLGFENAGFLISAAYDAWEPAIICYENNFKHKVFQMDLTDVKDSVKHIKQFEPYMIIGGPPCQDFSHAGSRIEGARADLTVVYAKIISKIKPIWFVMENVDRAINSNSYALAKNIFMKSGYGLNERIIDSSFCGVPQKRKRLFCIGLMGANDGFLNNTISSSLAKTPMTVRAYMGKELCVDNYYRHPRNYSRRGVFSIDEPAPTIRGVNRPVPKGYPGHPGDSTPVTPALRPLTAFERARLQTFPKCYNWIGTKSDMEQLIGNAVPVKLAEYVAYAILHYINKEQHMESA